MFPTGVTMRPLLGAACVPSPHSACLVRLEGIGFQNLEHRLLGSSCLLLESGNALEAMWNIDRRFWGMPHLLDLPVGNGNGTIESPVATWQSGLASRTELEGREHSYSGKGSGVSAKLAQ